MHCYHNLAGMLIVNNQFNNALRDPGNITVYKLNTDGADGTSRLVSRAFQSLVYSHIKFMCVQCWFSSMEITDNADVEF
jgi:hypothetical protein